MHLMQLMRLVPLWQFPSFMLSRCNGKVLTALEAAPSRQGCSGGTRSVLSEVQPSLRVVPLPPHKASAMGGRHSWVCGALNFWTSGNLQLADLRCAEVNEVTGQASDLMSALKSSDWHYAVTKSFWHIDAHCTLAASCIKHTGVFTVAHPAILHRECRPLKNNCAESMILSIKIWSLIWTPFYWAFALVPRLQFGHGSARDGFRGRHPKGPRIIKSLILPSFWWKSCFHELVWVLVSTWCLLDLFVKLQMGLQSPNLRWQRQFAGESTEDMLGG